MTRAEQAYENRFDGELSVEERRLLNYIDLVTEGNLTHNLNRYGLAHMTVCPECFCDDFTHAEGCRVLP